MSLIERWTIEGANPQDRLLINVAGPTIPFRAQRSMVREEDYNVLAKQLAGAVSIDDPQLIGTLARVIENRHGTLHGIGDTLREAIAEFKRERR